MLHETIIYEVTLTFVGDLKCILQSGTVYIRRSFAGTDEVITTFEKQKSAVLSHLPTH